MQHRKNNFTPELHKQLQTLNAKLIAIEKKLLATAIRLDSSLQYESTHNIDDLLDYDLVVEIECYNDVEDAEPLCTLRETVSHLSIPAQRDYVGFYIGDGLNHNTLQNYFPQKHLCWLFHCLYDHTGLSWKEIASITNLLVNIRTLHQYDFELSRKDTFAFKKE